MLCNVIQLNDEFKRKIKGKITFRLKLRILIGNKKIFSQKYLLEEGEDSQEVVPFGGISHV